MYTAGCPSSASLTAGVAAPKQTGFRLTSGCSVCSQLGKQCCFELHKAHVMLRMRLLWCPSYSGSKLHSVQGSNWFGSCSTDQHSLVVQHQLLLIVQLGRSVTGGLGP